MGVVIGLCLQWLTKPMLECMNSSGSLLSSFTGYTVFLWDLSTNVKADSNNMPFMSDDLSVFPKKVLKKLVFLDLGQMKCRQIVS